MRPVSFWKKKILMFVQLCSLMKIYINCYLHLLRSWWYPLKTVTDANYADDQVVFSKRPVQAESLLYNLEQSARGIRLYVDSEKTWFMYYNQDGAVSSLNRKPVKLVDQFIYLSSSISSTESNINIHIGKVWTAIDQLLRLWKSDLIK